MSHRVTHGSTASLRSRVQRIRRYLMDDPHLIGRGIRAMIIVACSLYAIGVVLTGAGSLLVVVDPFIALLLLGVANYVACGTGLAMLAVAVWAGLRIWRYGTAINRFSLVVAPAFVTLVTWTYSDVVLNAADKLAGVLFIGSDADETTESVSGLTVLLTFAMQAVMWAVLFALPILAMHGLGINAQRLNQPPHKLTDAKTGPGQAAFYHFAAGYGFTFLAVAAWFPFFATLI